MIRLLQPWFLAPGVLAAVIVTALHFLVRAPVRRAPLPTLRFLSPAQHTAVRLRRRPHDLRLLALRLLFALSLAAAFARPVWTATAVDRGWILLLDRGAGMAGVWNAALDSVSARLGGDPLMVIVFDTVAVVVAPGDAGGAWVDEMRDAGTSDAESDYRIAFHALAREAGSVAADTYEAALVTAPRWNAWREGTASMRAAAWPGRLEIIVAGPPETGSPESGPSEPGRSEAEAPERAAEPSLSPRVLAQPGGALFDAVEALGMSAVVDSASADVRIVGANGPGGNTPSGWRFVPDAVEADDIMVFSGGWSVAAPRAGALVRSQPAGGGATAPPARSGGAGAPSDGTGPTDEAGRTGSAIAAWRDGVLAAATIGDAPCTIMTAFDPAHDALTTSPDYPELIRHLVSGCVGGRAPLAAVPLDSGAMRTLRGAGNGTVQAADLPVPPPGRSVGTPLLLLALFCAVAEWGARRRHESSTPEVGAGV